MVHAGPVLDFRDDVDVLTAVLIQEIPHLQCIFFGGHKGRRHVIHVLLDAEQQILLILFAEERIAHQPSREIHALSVGQLAADIHPAQHVITVNFFYRAHHQAVVHQHTIALPEVFGESLVAYGNTGLIPFDILRGEGEILPIRQGDPMILEHADTVLRALGVQHDRNRQLQLLPNLPNRPDPLQMFLVISVGEVQPSHVQSRFAHLGKNSFRLAGRSDGADYFRFSHGHTPFRSSISLFSILFLL